MPNECKSIISGLTGIFNLVIPEWRMGIQSKGIVLIRVTRGEHGRWNVCESDFEDPLAAFDDRQSACDYANKLSANMEAATVLLLDESAPDELRRH
jgi:hypothetical protein